MESVGGFRKSAGNRRFSRWRARIAERPRSPRSGACTTRFACRRGHPQPKLAGDNVARYLASEIGAHMVLPDFLTAPTVRHPVSEQQAYDAFLWVHAYGKEMGWDGQWLSIGGPSSGSQVAFMVVAQSLEADTFLPVAVSSEVGVGDISLPEEQRSSPKAHPVVPPALQRLVKETYFAGIDLRNPMVSPRTTGASPSFRPRSSSPAASTPFATR